MKRKKGFTLIELLAVIIVLTIISLIGYTTVGNVIDNVNSSVEKQNARTLVKTAKEYIVLKNMNGNKIKEEEIYVFQDNIEYKIDSSGKRTRSYTFKFNGKICDYCVLKINEQEQVSLLLEGKNQDLKKDYDSDEFVSESLSQSREVTSLYNELNLFKDIYIRNNSVDEIKLFSSDNNVIYEISPDGTKRIVSNLYNSSGEGNIKITPSQQIITIKSAEGIIQIDNNGSLELEDNINSEYSDNILTLYEELQLVAERYISKNSISDEVYFEFNNGVINEVDLYGDNIAETNVVMNKNISGSGELRINSSNQFSVVIYDNNVNVKNDYGNNKLYSEQLPYSRDNAILFRNLTRLQNLAIKYLGGDTYDKYEISNAKISDSEWLVFFYIRRIKYNSSSYNEVTGNDAKFFTYVNDGTVYLETYFKNKNTFTINGDTIDLKHMAASLAGNMYNTDSLVNFFSYDEIEFDCLVSWAGDLHQLMEQNILKSGIKEQYGSYENATYSMMGKSNTGFSMEDVNADLDEWSLYYNFIYDKNNLSVGEMFEQYYTGKSTRNYKNRYSQFITRMTSIASGVKSSYKTFTDVVNHFTDTDKDWDTIGTLSIKPTDAQQKEIASGFVKWIQERADAE